MPLNKGSKEGEGGGAARALRNEGENLEVLSLQLNDIIILAR